MTMNRNERLEFQKLLERFIESNEAPPATSLSLRMDCRRLSPSFRAKSSYQTSNTWHSLLGRFDVQRTNVLGVVISDSFVFGSCY
jgi:hypothetical protein